MIISDWDSEYINVDQEGLSDILIAAHYLDIKPLVQLGCRTVADQLRGVPLDQLRKMANVPSDLSPEEQTQMRREIMKVSHAFQETEREREKSLTSFVQD